MRATPAAEVATPAQAAITPPADSAGVVPVGRPVTPAAAEAQLPSSTDRTAAAARSIAELERDAAAIIATGEHLGSSQDLLDRLGHPPVVDRQGRSVLWIYGRYAFVIEDELVLNVRVR